MAILFRSTSDFTVGGMEARLTVYSGENNRIRVEIAPYPAVMTTSYTGSLDVTVTYNGETKTLSAHPFTRSVSAIFTGVYWKKSITLSSSAGIVYNGTSSSALTVSWKGDGSIPAPALGISYYSGLRNGRTSRIQWTVSGVPEGYRAYTLGVWYCFAPVTQIEPEYTRICAVGEKSAAFELSHTIADLAEKNVVFYRIAVGLYPEDTAETAGRDDYERYLEIDSPAYVCSDTSLYRLAPCDLRCSTPGRDRVINITWKTLSAATETEGFYLQYSFNDSEWVTLFWEKCASKSWQFTLPEGESRVAFRLRAYSSRSIYEYSECVYSPWIEAGRTNVYVGHSGSIVPAAAVYLGSAEANAVLTVGGRE